jgi:hypothetical protein
MLVERGRGIPARTPSRAARRHHPGLRGLRPLSTRGSWPRAASGRAHGGDRDRLLPAHGALPFRHGAAARRCAPQTGAGHGEGCLPQGFPRSAQGQERIGIARYRRTVPGTDDARGRRGTVQTGAPGPPAQRAQGAGPGPGRTRGRPRPEKGKPYVLRLRRMRSRLSDHGPDPGNKREYPHPRLQRGRLRGVRLLRPRLPAGLPGMHGHHARRHGLRDDDRPVLRPHGPLPPLPHRVHRPVRSRILPGLLPKAGGYARLGVAAPRHDGGHHVTMPASKANISPPQRATSPSDASFAGRTPIQFPPTRFRLVFCYP